MADLDEDRDRAPARKLLGRILTALAYLIGIVVACAVVLAIAFAILWFEIHYYDLLRRSFPAMSLSHLPEPWRPDVMYKLGDRVTLPDEHNVFVLRCEKGGRSGLRPPKMPANAAIIAEHQHWPEIVKMLRCAVRVVA